MLWILLIAAGCIMLLVALTIIISLRVGVVPMPSSYNERKQVAEILKQFPTHTNIIDLGSGWGGFVRELSRKFPEKNISAVELSLVPHYFGTLISCLFGWKKITHLRKNLLEYKLSDRTVFVCYLSGPVMASLRKSFERDMPTGGVLISIAFAMPGWTPTLVNQAGDLYHSPIYVYDFNSVPNRVDS